MLLKARSSSGVGESKFGGGKAGEGSWQAHLINERLGSISNPKVVKSFILFLVAYVDEIFPRLLQWIGCICGHNSRSIYILSSHLAYQIHDRYAELELKATRISQLRILALSFE